MQAKPQISRDSLIDSWISCCLMRRLSPLKFKSNCNAPDVQSTMQGVASQKVWRLGKSLGSSPTMEFSTEFACLPRSRSLKTFPLNRVVLAESPVAARSVLRPR
ncbi:unnamed protein product [Heligmosomoides polygyrus]|uniref:Uncharacterized protein n=1 Tax=Heligmosomoides polygyrus TaxID=6339 RepID=A0A183FSG5_HELPZ|nr:unnamed protein product [Heligmosomoides polygyrus]